MMANWGTIMFLLFVIPLSWFIEVMAKGHHHVPSLVVPLSWFIEVMANGHHHVPSLRHSFIMVHRGENDHDSQLGNHHVPALRHSIIMVHKR
jgi:hypothetical protein